MLSFADNFQCIMRGGLIHLDLNSLLFFIEKMNELNINTLNIQQLKDKTYVCKVDIQTVRAFVEKFPDAPPYKIEDVQSKKY